MRLPFEQFGSGQLGSGREDVVGGLGAVDMVVWMNDRVVTLLAAENFDSAVGDDFVGVHVRGGACASLDWVAQELVMELTGNDLIAGLADGVLNLFVHLAYHAVAIAQAFLISAIELMNSGCSFWPVMWKFSAPRSDCTP